MLFLDFFAGYMDARHDIKYEGIGQAMNNNAIRTHDGHQSKMYLNGYRHAIIRKNRFNNL